MSSASVIDQSFSALSTAAVQRLEPLCHIITPIGMLSYGFDEDHTRQELEQLKLSPVPTVLILDSGSTDSGPSKLASGQMSAPRSSYERDLRKLLSLTYEYKVQLIIGSAGGDGSDAHVDELIEIIREICGEDGNDVYRFSTIAIYSNISKAKVLCSLKSSLITSCGKCVPALEVTDIETAAIIVAQMGPEPYVDAILSEPNFDIIIGGRSYDPSPYVAFCMFHASKTQSAALYSSQVGGSSHMGKIMECGALCATPKSASAMATVYANGTFDITPLGDGIRCTPFSVAAHTLYEKSRPDLLSGPGGDLDLTRSSYLQLEDGRSVRASGAVFNYSRVAGLPYTVKLEGAKSIGYRSIFMGGIRDPILISQMINFQARVREYVASQICSPAEDFWKLGFHTYGIDGVMGYLEPEDLRHVPREVFLVGEILASTQNLANLVAHTAANAVIHGPYPGQRGTGGNFAKGVGGKTEIEMGPCAEFCIYHLMPIAPGDEGAQMIGSIPKADQKLFSWKKTAIGKGEPSGISSKLVPAAAMLASVNDSRTKTGVSFVSTLNFTTPKTLADIAPVIRSKNAGPYEITLDVVFSSREIYEIIKSSSLLTPSLICQLYHIGESDIIWCGFYNQALAWKCTIPRFGDVVPLGAGGFRAGQEKRKVIPNGSFMESDVHASQQYAGLLSLELSEEVKQRIKAMDLIS